MVVLLFKQLPVLETMTIQPKHTLFVQRGTTMIEVLVTMVILAFGLLGLIGLQGKMQLASFEAYQRAQAVVLLTDMVDRLNANRLTADNFVSASVFGTGLTDASPCPAAVGPARDQCEWSVALKGASETLSSANIGAIAGARGCIARIQAPDATPGVCAPGIYLVTVAWQGMNSSVAPSATCGTGLYGSEPLRRAISARVVVGKPECS